MIMALVIDDGIAIGFGGGLNGGTLAFVGRNGIAIGFGRGLNGGTLAFVGRNSIAIRFGRSLDSNLTLNAPLDSGLEVSLSG